MNLGVVVGSPAKPVRVGFGLPRRISPWMVVAFGVALALAISPNIVNVYGIHNDYEMLLFKNPGFLHHEAEHLFAIGRPVAALLSNLTLLPVQSMSDYRWTRIFSLLSVCFLGYQLMSICVHRLRTSAFDATMVGLATFLVPAYIYSILDAPAWAPHLVPIALAFVAYELLSRTNIQTLPLAGIVARREVRAGWQMLVDYARLPDAWRASAVLQLAFYTFPPNALVLTLLPIIGVLFSRTPAVYRVLLAIRDLGFVAVNVVIYVVSAKLIYFPIVRLFTYRNTTAWQESQLGRFDARGATSYKYSLNTNIDEVIGRLEHLGRVAGDLWFLPQTRFHVFLAVIIAAGTLAAMVRFVLRRRKAQPSAMFGVFAASICAVCFLLSGAAVLGAGGGFVSYRTVPITTAVAALLLLWAVWSVASAAGGTVGRIALLAVAISGVAGNFQLNLLTMKLARSEASYFQSILKQARDEGTNVIFLVDQRPFFLPEDIPVLTDQKGRPVPPYELGCLSSICLQNGAILTILAQEQGTPRGQLRIFPFRGPDPVPGITCELLRAPTLAVPPGAPSSAAASIRFWRSLAPFTCVPFSLAWHDLDR